MNLDEGSRRAPSQLVRHEASCSRDGVSLLSGTLKLSPVAALMDLWGVLVVSESVGNLSSNEINHHNRVFFFLITRGHANNLPLLLFFRANIDEVETEVVEIEAKLDKVRRDVSRKRVPCSFIWWVLFFSLPVKHSVCV